MIVFVLLIKVSLNDLNWVLALWLKSQNFVVFFGGPVRHLIEAHNIRLLGERLVPNQVQRIGEVTLPLLVLIQSLVILPVHRHISDERSISVI